MCLRLVLKPLGDYPDHKYTGGWDALCTTQQRAFHGQSIDPLTGVRLRQCNPELFNQITRAWEEKNEPLNNTWGKGYVARYEFQCQWDLCPQNATLICRHPKPTGERQESLRSVETGKVCKGWRSNPHNLIPRNPLYWRGNILLGWREEKLRREDTDSISVRRLLVFGRHKSHKWRKECIAKK